MGTKTVKSRFPYLCYNGEIQMSVRSETEFFENDNLVAGIQTIYFSESLGGVLTPYKISDPNSAGRTRFRSPKHHMLTFSSRYISRTDQNPTSVVCAGPRKCAFGATISPRPSLTRPYILLTRNHAAIQSLYSPRLAR